MGSFVLFFLKLNNLKSDLWQSSAFFQYTAANFDMDYRHPPTPTSVYFCIFMFYLIVILIILLFKFLYLISIRECTQSNYAKFPFFILVYREFYNLDWLGNFTFSLSNAYTILLLKIVFNPPIWRLTLKLGNVTKSRSWFVYSLIYFKINTRDNWIFFQYSICLNFKKFETNYY